MSPREIDMKAPKSCPVYIENWAIFMPEVSMPFEVTERW